MTKKVLSSKKAPLPKGGSTKMFGKSGAGPQKPGVTSSEGRSAGGKPHGGSTKMFGKQSASPAKAC
jgi:hypothetical protein